MALVVKNPPANAGDIRDTSSIPESGRSPGGGPGNPLQSSCLENPMDRGAWWAVVHGVTESRTRLSDFTFTLGFPGGSEVKVSLVPIVWGKNTSIFYGSHIVLDNISNLR